MTEDQKRLERIEQDLRRLTRMVMILLPPGYYQQFLSEMQKDFERAQRTSTQSVQDSAKGDK